MFTVKNSVIYPSDIAIQALSRFNYQFRLVSCSACLTSVASCLVANFLQPFGSKSAQRQRIREQVHSKRTLCSLFKWDLSIV